jgi:chromosome partitioning protein
MRLTIVNQHEAGTVSGQTWLDELSTAAQTRGLNVLTPPIPKRVVISDATEAARGLDEWGSAEASTLGVIYAGHLASIEGDQR